MLHHTAQAVLLKNTCLWQKTNTFLRNPVPHFLHPRYL